MLFFFSVKASYMQYSSVHWFLKHQVCGHSKLWHWWPRTGTSFFFFWFPHFWSEMGPAVSRHGIFFAHVLGGDQVERSPSLCGFASSRAAHPWRVRVPLQCCMDVALCLEASKNIWSVKKKPGCVHYIGIKLFSGSLWTSKYNGMSQGFFSLLTCPY